MSKTPRVDVEGYYYHVFNRANAKVQIFYNSKDYQAFESILEEAHEKFNINLFSYCIMPNHWHLILSINKDGDLQKYMKWITGVHTARWHAAKNVVGQGHLYQGRYKSFICQDDFHLPTLIRYVERNPKKAGLVKKAEDWQWGSLWRRTHGTCEQKKILSDWPMTKPNNYLAWVNQSSPNEEGFIDVSASKGSPYGDFDWKNETIKRFKLESTVRARGRPKK